MGVMICRSPADEWRSAFENLYCLTVVPRRSVDRIREALAEGRDVEPYLADIENDLNAAADLSQRVHQAEWCSHCGGTGWAPASSEERP